MNKKLLEALCNKKVLNTGTVIASYYPAKMLGGMATTKLIDDFNFVDYKNEKIKLKRVNTNEIYVLTIDNIVNIDGMDPARLAGIYGIKSDGSNKKEKIDPITGLPVRRGRKTNKVKELINDRLNQLRKHNPVEAGINQDKTRKSSN